MSVELSPSTQLGFPRPFTKTTQRSLLIHNPHSSPIAFKVKTTAPKQYCVRPNSGRVESGESVEVAVLLQPLAQDPPPHAKCKDKFLVQSAFITPDEEMHSLGEMWTSTEKTNKAAIHEQKIKCVYLPPEDGAVNTNGIPEEDETAASPTGPAAGEKSMMEESQIFDHAPSSPTHGGFNGNSTPPAAAAYVPSGLGPIITNTSAPTTTTTSAEKPKEIPSLTSKDIESSGPSATNLSLEQSLASTTSDSDKLAMALKEIDQLRSQLTEASGPQVTGLRKRGGAAPGGGSAETVVEKAKEVVAGQQGVPLEVVVGLVVGVFVMTYLFF